MSRLNRKPVAGAPVAGANMPLANLLAEMIGLGVLLAGQSPYARLQAGMAAANEADSPLDPACDDLFDNVPV